MRRGTLGQFEMEPPGPGPEKNGARARRLHEDFSRERDSTQVGAIDLNPPGIVSTRDACARQNA